jgi:hypothetical protein
MEQGYYQRKVEPSILGGEDAPEVLPAGSERLMFFEVGVDPYLKERRQEQRIVTLQLVATVLLTWAVLASGLYIWQIVRN